MRVEPGYGNRSRAIRQPTHITLRGGVNSPTRVRTLACENGSVEESPAGTEIHSERISGLIERGTFFNEEAGFCVLRVKAAGHRDLVTVVGSSPSVSAGEWLTAEGTWVR